MSHIKISVCPSLFEIKLNDQKLYPVIFVNKNMTCTKWDNSEFSDIAKFVKNDSILNNTGLFKPFLNDSNKHNINTAPQEQVKGSH